ncbi:hypothetical protein BDR03DRAFT_954131 [Suillus americanus]|nr:hypothetical protein BDR03DRAFT_954131 [Suillus americanus]
MCSRSKKGCIYDTRLVMRFLLFLYLRVSVVVLLSGGIVRCMWPLHWVLIGHKSILRRCRQWTR